jgi:virginiamycin B lyase
MTTERRQRARPSSPTLVAALALLAAMLLSLALVPRAEAFLYWTNQGPDTIGRANLDGSGVRQSFISDAAGPTGIAVDADHIYWANGETRTIGRADIDGTNVTETLISDVGSPQGVAVGAGHIYWANQMGAIGRADIDGTNVDRDFITVPEEPTGIAVDAAHIYWGTFSGGIGRADIGGTNVDQGFLGGGGSATTGIAVDADHIYWGNYAGGISRANLDGTAVNGLFIAGSFNTYGIALDAGRIYWADRPDTILRANLDTSGFMPGFIDADDPYGLAVDSGNDPVPEIRHLRVRPRSFVAAPGPTALARARGTRIKISLSEPAKVRFRVRHDPPRHKGGPAPRNPHVFKRRLQRGENSVPFTATLGGRTFSPGRYTLIARARDSANQPSERVTAHFQIK